MNLQMLILLPIIFLHCFSFGIAFGDEKYPKAIVQLIAAILSFTLFKILQ